MQYSQQESVVWHGNNYKRKVEACNMSIKRFHQSSLQESNFGVFLKKNCMMLAIIVSDLTINRFLGDIDTITGGLRAVVAQILQERDACQAFKQNLTTVYTNNRITEMVVLSFVDADGRLKLDSSKRYESSPRSR